MFLKINYFHSLINYICSYKTRHKNVKSLKQDHNLKKRKAFLRFEDNGPQLGLGRLINLAWGANLN